jgi:hypothetical protein
MKVLARSLLCFSGKTQAMHVQSSINVATYRVLPMDVSRPHTRLECISSRGFVASWVEDAGNRSHTPLPSMQVPQF